MLTADAQDSQDPTSLLQSMIETLHPEGDPRDLSQMLSKHQETTILNENTLSAIDKQIKGPKFNVDVNMEIKRMRAELEVMAADAAVSDVGNNNRILDTEISTLTTDISDLQRLAATLTVTLETITRSVQSLAKDQTEHPAPTREVIVLSILQKLGVEFYDFDGEKGVFQKGLCKSVASNKVVSFPIKPQMSRFYWSNYLWDLCSEE